MSELYDTCVFIDYWAGDAGALSLIESARNQPGTFSFSPISAAEIWQFPGLGRQEEIEFVALAQYFLREVPLSTAVAIRAGQWLRSYSRNARMRLAADALIAATAEGRGDRVRTKNERDIRRFYSEVQTY